MEENMDLKVESAQGKVPVSILKMKGDLDASNFEQVIDKAKELYSAGSRYLLLDMSEVPFMSSSGIVALHSIVLLFQGKPAHDPEAGWEVFREIERDRASGIQPYVKLLNPHPRVVSVLQKTGMDNFFEV